VRRQHYVFQGEQWIIRRDRLGLENVQPRRGQPPVSQCVDQCAFVDDGTAGGVDQVCRTSAPIAATMSWTRLAILP